MARRPFASRELIWALVAAAVLIEIVAKPAGITIFVVLPKRSIVARAFARRRQRRLSKDDEALPATSEARIHVAMIHLMLRRLAPR